MKKIISFTALALCLILLLTGCLFGEPRLFQPKFEILNEESISHSEPLALKITNWQGGNTYKIYVNGDEVAYDAACSDMFISKTAGWTGDTLTVIITAESASGEVKQSQSQSINIIGTNKIIIWPVADSDSFKGAMYAAIVDAPDGKEIKNVQWDIRWAGMEAKKEKVSVNEMHFIKFDKEKKAAPQLIIENAKLLDSANTQQVPAIPLRGTSKSAQPEFRIRIYENVSNSTEYQKAWNISIDNPWYRQMNFSFTVVTDNGNYNIVETPQDYGYIDGKFYTKAYSKTVDIKVNAITKVNGETHLVELKTIKDISIF